jgi:hypothetical protein
MYQSTHAPQPDETILKFANGSTFSVPTYAKTTCANLTGVVNGPSFYQNCIVPTQLQSPGDSASTRPGTQINEYVPVAAQTQLPGVPQYGPPYIISNDASIAGFFPSIQPDLAVLVFPTFAPKDDVDFQNTLRSFLATATASNKKKLILDLRANGGGNVMDGFDMFKQLFPSQDPYAASNLAAPPVIDALGQVATALVSFCEVSMKRWVWLILAEQIAEGKADDFGISPLTELDVKQNLTPEGGNFAS